MTSTCSLFTPRGARRNPPGACDLGLWEHIWNLRMVSELREGTSHTARLNCKHCAAPQSQKLHQPPAPEAFEWEGRWNWTLIVQGISIPQEPLWIFKRKVMTWQFFFFNWRIIALQCCINFCRTMQISHNYIYELPLEPPSPLPSHPSRSSQRHRLGSPC